MKHLILVMLFSLTSFNILALDFEIEDAEYKTSTDEGWIVQYKGNNTNPYLTIIFIKVKESRGLMIELYTSSDNDYYKTFTQALDKFLEWEDIAKKNEIINLPLKQIKVDKMVCRYYFYKTEYVYVHYFFKIVNGVCELHLYYEESSSDYWKDFMTLDKSKVLRLKSIIGKMDEYKEMEKRLIAERSLFN